MSPLLGHAHHFHGPDLYIYIFIYILSGWDVLSEKAPFCCAGTAEEEPPAEETDAQPVKRAAEEEEVG